MREGIYLNSEPAPDTPLDGFVIYYHGGMYKVGTFTACTMPFIRQHAAARYLVNPPVYVVQVTE